MTPDLSPNAFAVEYELVIRGWPVRAVGGDAGGLLIRFTNGDVLAKSVMNSICPDAKEAVQKILEALLKNIESIQQIAERNAEAVVPTLKVQVE